MPLICYNTPIHLYLVQGSVQSYAVDMMRESCRECVGDQTLQNPLGTQNKNQTLPQHQEAQSSLAVGHFTKLALRKVFYAQILKNALKCF